MTHTTRSWVWGAVAVLVVFAEAGLPEGHGSKPPTTTLLCAGGCCQCQLQTARALFCFPSRGWRIALVKGWGNEDFGSARSPAGPTWTRGKGEVPYTTRVLRRV